MFARLLVCSSLLALSAFADTEHQCNYEPTGDVTKASGVNINGFKTGGDDKFRTNFCVGHCLDRKSLRASMVINLQKPSSPVATELNYSKKISGQYMTSQLGETNYCKDKSVSDIIENAFESSNDLESMAAALNKNLNKPGWAWLLFEANFSPSLVFVFNPFQDVNFCHKIKSTVYNMTSFDDFYFVGGLIM